MKHYFFLVFLLITSLFTTLTSFSAVRVRALRPKISSEMTISGYTGASTLTNFPVAVRISPSSIAGFDYEECDGPEDISFSDKDGNLLPCEIDVWNTEGESVAWVSIPNVVSNTTFKMNWMHSVKPNYSTIPNPWSLAKYFGVWHMNSPYDSTASVNYQTNSTGGLNLTVCGTSMSFVDNGKIGKQMTNTTYEELLALPLPTENDLNKEALVFSGWTYWEGYTSPNGRNIFFGELSYSSYWELHVKNCKLASKFAGGNPSYIGNTYVNQNWLHWAIKVTGLTSFQYYVNGILTQTRTGIKNNYINALSTIYYKANGTTGHTDELRIQNIAASDDWIKAEFDSINNTSFIVASPAILRPRGSILFFR